METCLDCTEVEAKGRIKGKTDKIRRRRGKEEREKDGEEDGTLERKINN